MDNVKESQARLTNALMLGNLYTNHKINKNLTAISKNQQQMCWAHPQINQVLLTVRRLSLVTSLKPLFKKIKKFLLLTRRIPTLVKVALSNNKIIHRQRKQGIIRCLRAKGNPIQCIRTLGL